MHFLNSLAPGRSGWNSRCICLKHFLLMNIFSISLWLCPLVIAKELHWWQINIVSGNDFVPSEWFGIIRQQAIALTNIDQVLWCNMAAPCHNELTHWGQEKISVALLMWIYFMAYSEFWFKFRCNLFLNVQLTPTHHWFRWWLGTKHATTCTSGDPVHLQFTHICHQASMS